jgi:hypothetical protein
MSERYRFVVMLEMETNDPRLSEDALAEGYKTVHGTATVRRAVLQHMPKDVSRVVAVMPLEHAKALMALHEAAGEMLSGEQMMVRPPADYVPPTQE